MWTREFSVEIDVVASQAPGSALQLQTRHIILGLYETMIAVSENSRFCELQTRLSLHGRQIGILKIVKKVAGTTTEMNNLNATTSTMAKPSLNGDVLTYPSGQVIDTSDPSFSMSYAYSGVRINSRDIFMAAIDALAIAAQFDPGTAFSSLHAESASGNCLISIAQVDGLYQMSYIHVTRALRIMVADVMLTLNYFGAVELVLKRQGVPMGKMEVKLAGNGATAY